jgi:hypothetical protein
LLYGVEAPSGDGADVLQEEVAGSNRANEVHDDEEEAGSAGADAAAVAGVGDVLAGKPADNHVRTMAEEADGERPNVGPHRCRNKASFLHILRQPEGVLDPVLHVAERLNLRK